MSEENEQIKHDLMAAGEYDFVESDVEIDGELGVCLFCKGNEYKHGICRKCYEYRGMDLLPSEEDTDDGEISE